MTFKNRAIELVSKMTLAEKISQMVHTATAIDRLGVSEYNWWNECLHGVGRAGVATVFPQAIGLAASFDQELMFDIATAISDEARAKYNEFKKFGDTKIYQGLTYWSPNINIFRDPRWGRGHETYGEDPVLTGKMAVPFIKGLQGDGKYRKLDATIKHYAVHSGPELGRHGFDVKVSDKDLYETYLWAFKYCIDNADPSAVMGAYNSIDGEPCCASERMLQKILYGEFGFKGYVVSDCGAICDIHQFHKLTKNEAESAALAVNNGCQMNCGNAYKWLKTAVVLDMVSEETITKSCEKLFEARFRLGMFDNDCEYDNIPYEVVSCEKHRKLNRTIAQDSLVLLKNDGILPLKDSVKTIAVMGANADDIPVLLGNYNGTPDRAYTFLRGIQNGSDKKVIYARGCEVFEEKTGDWLEQPLREAIIAAKKSDLVVMCLGLNSTIEGEQGDAYNGAFGGDKPDIELPKVQRDFFEEIVKVGTPIVFVNVSGSCINLERQKESCSAIVQAFYPGAEAGNALADVIFGKVSPSGRLPLTFYRSTDDLPDFKDYSMENRTYKFFKGEVVYPFGHGLNYSKITENWTDENTVELENSGEFDTKYSVLQYEYIPHKSLKDFKKVFIKKGEKIVINFS